MGSSPNGTRWVWESVGMGQWVRTFFSMAELDVIMSHDHIHPSVTPSSAPLFPPSQVLHYWLSQTIVNGIYSRA